MRMRRSDSTAHLLLWRSTVSFGSNLRSTGRLYAVRSRANVGRRGARCQLCCPCRGPCADDLRRTGESCERILLHGMLFGKKQGKYCQTCSAVCDDPTATATTTSPVKASRLASVEVYVHLVRKITVFPRRRTPIHKKDHIKSARSDGGEK